MGLYTTKPVKELTKLELKELLLNKIIKISFHALDHLGDDQRKIFKEKELTNMIKKENPRKIFLQENGRYSLNYRRKDGYREIIIEFKKEKAVIVSFMNNNELPKIRH